MKSNWWYNATPEERMAQVKNGAQLGMSPEQIAANLKVKTVVIRFFGRDHNIKFKEQRKPAESILDGATVVADAFPGDTINEILDVEDTDFMIDILSTFGDIFASSIEEWN